MPSHREAGLCGNCAHVKKIANNRGSIFHLCTRAKTDPSYAQYPRLPVLQCKGWTPQGSAGAQQ